jgi:hypothetical protein
MIYVSALYDLRSTTALFYMNRKSHRQIEPEIDQAMQQLLAHALPVKGKNTAPFQPERRGGIDDLHPIFMYGKPLDLTQKLLTTCRIEPTASGERKELGGEVY